MGISSWDNDVAAAPLFTLCLSPSCNHLQAQQDNVTDPFRDIERKGVLHDKP
ncbi:hypothetical protein [Bradyrhizobium sp. SZCCHNPS2010]|uniref:hypothetical protein n=1 Tax=Bradyrhizobium sp. SZCCHNPS2010 TaxID=3057333 RepID=UPI002916FC4B|nr:hypothetical protein [Bradyrhizobium sp. SZCCHNPS2010]